MFFQRFPKTQYDFYENGKTTTIPDLFRSVSTTDKRFVSATTYQDYNIQEERPDQLSFKLYGTPNFYWTFFIINDKLKGGMNSWPFSYNDMQDYIDTKYPNYTIRLYRENGDDINYNDITSKWLVGSVLTGVTSGATAIITKRDTSINQLTFEYNSDLRFSTNEIINGVGSQTIVDKYQIRTEKNSIHHFVDGEDKLVGNFENFEFANGIVTNRDNENNINDSKASIRVIRSQFVEDFAIIYRRLINE